MPVDTARRLTGARRSPRGDRELGLVLAFVAGALNAGGFLAVAQYTSHVTGMVSTVADQAVLGRSDLVVDALVGVLAFLLGAACCALLVNFARRRGLRSIYALPLLVEAALILVFGLIGLFGSQLSQVQGLLLPATVLLLCFTMGLQNAVITKLSGAVIRTTHLTGIVTDLGLELGRALYPSRGADAVRADRGRALLLAGLLTAFLGGGLAGAFGFKAYGYASTLPLALLLGLLALVPALDDLSGNLTSAGTDADSCG